MAIGEKHKRVLICPYCGENLNQNMQYAIMIQGSFNIEAETIEEALKKARLKVINENATNLEYIIEEIKEE
jgi:hypothetical protein